MKEINHKDRSVVYVKDLYTEEDLHETYYNDYQNNVSNSSFEGWLEIMDKDEINPKEVSDGFHTFEELYDHRTVLFISLCKLLNKDHRRFTVVRSLHHGDGTMFDGMFIIMVINNENKQQISYHLNMRWWNTVREFLHLPLAPNWDGHTSDDVLNRLLKWI